MLETKKILVRTNDGNPDVEKDIMLKVEYLSQEKSQPFAPFTHVSIEHVLPQKPKAGSVWHGTFTEEHRKLWIDRLANLVLLCRIKTRR